jgi:HD-GYP domain-containing protein (c-di-GMP phosphodiesterase class II)
VFDPASQILEFTTGKGFKNSSLQYTRLRLGEGFAGLAAIEHRLIFIKNLAESIGDLKRPPPIDNEGFQTYFAVPLIAKGQIKGILEIFHRTAFDPDPDWTEFLETLAGQAAIAIENATLFKDLQRTNIELTMAYDATIEGWSKALEMRDQGVSGHTQRANEMTLVLAQKMGLNSAELIHIRRGSLLHDIGEMGIPEYILLKPGKLTDGERDIVQQHPIYAYKLLSSIPNLRPAIDIPYCHHEKWDGSGYPRGIMGEEIPLPARIFTLADVWFALLADRPYRQAWSREMALTYVREQKGRHFDPRIVELFLSTYN